MVFEFLFCEHVTCGCWVGVDTNMTPEQKTRRLSFFFRRQFGRGHGQSDREPFAVDADSTAMIRKEKKKRRDVCVNVGRKVEFKTCPFGSNN